LTCEKTGDGIAEVTVEVSPEEFESAVSSAFVKNRKRLSVPGFRKGKAPRKTIERVYGLTVFHSDAIESLLPDALRFAIDSSDLKVIGRPQVMDFDVNEESGGAEVSIKVSIYPEVTLGEYKGISAVKPSAQVLDSEIDYELGAIRNRNARIEIVDRPAKDADIVIIDFDGFIDGAPFEGGKATNYELVLGSGSFIPGFEKKILGMVVGEQRSIELTFPEDYDEKFAGKPVVFDVKLNEVKEKLLPELDDEFAVDVSEFDTLDEYKNSIREKLEKNKQEDVDAAFENALMDEIVDSMQADVPDIMIEEQMDSAVNGFTRQISSYGMDPASYLQMMDITPEMFRERMLERSERQVRITLALEKIAELEAFEVSEDEVEAEYSKAAEQNGMEIEKLRETVSKETIINEIKIRRAAEFVIDNAVVKAPDEEPTEKT